ncbi:hypothetical protein IAG32_12180 [Achromobacter xylosoxidans]|uniref:Lipoprotein n=2 Tax=Alcaligenes xylosoxydans xylosoxydans TaxID=85698 RepID=A0A424WGG4_ALCXX|nr:hypothetical protein [Achromobacter xylosoxidans]MBD0867475.1 hypothetical protein [Achromobacter xylosoxidans]QNP88487.1 hypothetical protein IAG39_13675 [Achromobacter xylosoxidans]RPJ92376.1 hypothetical protein DY367_07680 [Achromobacter xylosoxidans]
MKKSMPLVLLSSILLTACGPDKIIADLPSPDGKYHVEVRKCPQRGSLTWDEQTQVSVVEAGVSEKCNAFIVALTQFRSYAPDEQLQLEWISDTELRAWHPAFEPKNGAWASTIKQGAPVKVIFAPKS